MNVTSKLTIDLNGHTITTDGGQFVLDASLTVTDSKDGGKIITAAAKPAIVQNKGGLGLKGGTIENAVENNWAIEVNDGICQLRDHPSTIHAAVINSAVGGIGVKVNGGDFRNNVDVKNTAENGCAIEINGGKADLGNRAIGNSVTDNSGKNGMAVRVNEGTCRVSFGYPTNSGENGCVVEVNGGTLNMGSGSIINSGADGNAIRLNGGTCIAYDGNAGCKVESSTGAAVVVSGGTFSLGSNAVNHTNGGTAIYADKNAKPGAEIKILGGNVTSNKGGYCIDSETVPVTITGGTFKTAGTAFKAGNFNISDPVSEMPYVTVNVSNNVTVKGAVFELYDNAQVNVSGLGAAYNSQTFVKDNPETAPVTIESGKFNSGCQNVITPYLTDGKTVDESGMVVSAAGVLMNGESYKSLAEAIAAAGTNPAIITLQDELIINKPVSIAAGQNITIDLGDYMLMSTLVASTGNNIVSISNSGTLTMIAGEKGTYFNPGANGVNLQNEEGGKLYIGQEGKNNGPMFVRNYDGTCINNNGGEVVIYDVDFQAHGSHGSCSALGSTGGTMVVKGGSIPASVGVFLLGGEVTIEKDVTMSNYDGVGFVAGGTLNFNGCNIEEAREMLVYAAYGDAQVNFNGATVKGLEGIGMMSEGFAASININGGTFTEPLAIYNEGGASNITITDGNFEQGFTFEDSTEEGAVSITGGTFANDVSQYLGENFKQDENGNVIEEATQPVILTDAGASAIVKEDGTGTIRFITKVDALNGTPVKFGTYMIPLSLFDTKWDTNVVVEYTQSISAGETFAADLTDIPESQLPTDIYARSFMFLDGVENPVTAELNAESVNTAMSR